MPFCTTNDNEERKRKKAEYNRAYRLKRKIQLQQLSNEEDAERKQKQAEANRAYKLKRKIEREQRSNEDIQTQHEPPQKTFISTLPMFLCLMEKLASFFVWVNNLNLSGMGGPTSSIRYRQHSSQDHVTTQAPPLCQQCSQTQSKVYPQCHRPSVTPTSIKILHKHTHIYISTNMLSENRKESKTL
jgi:hypothetical protein